jgi:hypothetical protein
MNASITVSCHMHMPMHSLIYIYHSELNETESLEATQIYFAQNTWEKEVASLLPKQHTGFRHFANDGLFQLPL